MMNENRKIYRALAAFRRADWMRLLCLCGILVAAESSAGLPALPAFKSAADAVKQRSASASAVPIQRVDVKFAWNAANDSSVVGYRLQYGRASGSVNQTNRITVYDTTTATLALDVGVTYYVTCVSFNGLGVESIPSNEVTITPQLVYKTYLSGSTDMVTWTDLCEVQTTNAAQMLRLESRPVNLAK